MKKLTINDLRPAPYNPRAITDESLDALGHSLQKFGDISGIVWNKRSRHLVCGHQRLEALRKDYKTLRVEGNEIVAECPRAGKNGVKKTRRFPIRIVNWDDGQEKAANITANNPLLMGTFTDDLGPLLESLQEDLGDVYEKLRFDELVQDYIGPKEGITDPDDVPEVPKKPKSKTGDLYALGDHRLLCGDATKTKDVAKLMDGERAQMIFTSPPYNMAGGLRYPKRGKMGDLYLSYCDDKTSADYIAFNIDAIEVAKSILGEGANVLWNMGYNANARWEYLAVVLAFIHDCSMRLMETIVWKKRIAMPIPGEHFTRNHEFVFWFINGNEITTLNKTIYEVIRSVWEIDNYNAQLIEHAACFPVELPAKALNIFSAEYARCYEPFGGSGSTLIACEQTNRKCYMMEIDPHYCDVIVNRWEEFTGKKAHKQ